MRGAAILVCCVIGGSLSHAPEAAAQSVTAQSATAPARPRLSRQDVDRLVAQARQAMKDGDLDGAESLSRRAESSGASYPLLYFGDNPTKLRRDLAKLRAARPQAASEAGSAALASPEVPLSTTPDPFRERLAPLPSAPKTTPFAPQFPAQGLPGAEPMALPQLSPGQSPNNPFAQGDAPRALPSPGDAAMPSRPRIGMTPQVSQAFDGLGAPSGSAVVTAEATEPVLQTPPTRYPVTSAEAVEPVGAPRYADPARYDLNPPEPTAPTEPPNSLRLAQTTPPFAERLQPLTPELPATAAQLLERGEQALRDQNRAEALSLFQQAGRQQDQLEPSSRGRLQEHLRMLSPVATTPPAPPAPPAAVAADAEPLAPGPIASEGGTLEALDGDQQVIARQLSADVGKQQLEARGIREEDPKRALEILQQVRQQVEQSQAAEEVRRQLLARIDVTLAETERYIEDNRAQIELDEQNAAVLGELDRRRAVEVKVQEQVAELVDQFNKLRDEQRYEEMEIVARRLYDLAPDEPVAQQVWENAKFIRRNIMNQDLMDRKEMANWKSFNDVNQSSVANVGDGNEMVFPDIKDWEDINNRSKLTDRDARRSERELEIERKLRMPVLLKYTDRPLTEVIDGLSQMSGINIHIDPRGLTQEGVSTDTPVTINLTGEISLKSALNLILEPLHLSYMVKDEVLKITSEQLRDGDIKNEVYYVADLVMPIPNFVPSNNIGLQGMLNDAYAAMGYGGGGLGVPGPIALAASRGPRGADGMPNEAVMAQQMGGSSGPMIGGLPSTMPMASGPGGLGGGAQADFDSLIDLIISTVASDTWAENGGGEAEIRPFPTNLSLVISQTQAVHEEIADLLEQLRRLQDLQVTIEVRFIRLNDNFFERIGIDFDMNIADRTPIAVPPGLPPGTAYEGGPSVIVGMNESTSLTDFPRFTADLDIPFRQNSFGVTAPAFGGFDPAGAATFGFAILSDIEAYFLVQAAQGDSRSNVLNAPKVTLFNGQQAFVSDTSQTPFVISVIPVVGEFAAAQQPVIVVLSEGTMMTIQAVISDDRRYVRLTVVPFFSQIGDVTEFTFEGRESTASSSSSTSESDDGDSEDETEEITERAGTTVQLPQFIFVSVTTTVSVPDGGTVLLGGIKRLRESRNEVGVPLLSKVPYVNRLFKNIGIGRETDSLMMMVTPRIIIQEEEEERLGITPPNL
ncbi:MAG: hypothetical protein WD851_09845 [Pirellulales bacterium]